MEAGTVEASREECLALLATAPFRRLVLTEGALPAVLPVNFLLDPAGIVIRTAEGSSASLAGGRRAPCRWPEVPVRVRRVRRG